MRRSSQSLRETPNCDNPSAYFLSLSINAPHIDPEPEPHINKQIENVRTFARLQNDLQPILPSELGFNFMGSLNRTLLNRALAAHCFNTFKSNGFLLLTGGGTSNHAFLFSYAVCTVYTVCTVLYCIYCTVYIYYI